MSFSQAEEEILFKMIEEITGTCQKGNFKKDILSSNVERRIGTLGLKSFSQYILLLAEDDEEFDTFVSSITIHTTYWFRELPHFKILEEDVIRKLNENHGQLSLKLWSSACSTGQEAYSIAFVMEKICKLYPGFSYEVFASDIDDVSVKKAIAGKYSLKEFASIPAEYHPYVQNHHDYFVVKDLIRKKIKFFNGSLLDDFGSKFNSSLNYIFCRNVLIYFDNESTSDIISSFQKYITKNGLLLLGHSENFDTSKTNFKLEKNSTFRFLDPVSTRSTADSDSILRSFNNPQLIAIGASTGGPETLDQFLKNFPKPCPPVVVVQHINPRFCESFAERLAAISGLTLKDTSTKVPLLGNSIYLAWSDYHLVITEENGQYFIQPSSEPKKNGHRPSVDTLFESVSRTRIRSISVLLTGMGRDGAEGLLKIRQTKRSLTMAQNQETSVVFGMPKEAIERDAATIIGSDRYLSQLVRDYVSKKLGFRKAS